MFPLLGVPGRANEGETGFFLKNPVSVAFQPYQLIGSGALLSEPDPLILPIRVLLGTGDENDD